MEAIKSLFLVDMLTNVLCQCPQQTHKELLNDDVLAPYTENLEVKTDDQRIAEVCLYNLFMTLVILSDQDL